MDDDDFLDAMSDVRLLIKKKHVLKKEKKHMDVNIQALLTDTPRSKVAVQRFETAFQFHEKGVSAREMQRVATASNIEATLDLHGLYVQAALDACVCFLKQSLSMRRRLLCIIHGRGLHSPDNRPVLKEEVFRWLKEGPYSNSILAVKMIQAGGASLIYLRRKR